MKFSVLMSIYKKENPEYFERCMRSIWDEQNLKPNEIVLVQDGPLTEGLYNVIDSWQKKLGQTFKTISLKSNVGTGRAKNIGLKNCTYGLIAIMDTDDISLPDRFEKQLMIFQKYPEIDVCGGWIAEFNNTENNILNFRRLPEYHEDILAFSKQRMPVNHNTIMFKKKKVLKAGGYRHFLWFEDYYLVVRLLQQGAKFYNIPSVLLKMRAGNNMLRRRRGLQYAIQDAKFQMKMFNMGYINIIELIRNLIFRVPIRLLPIFVVEMIYKKLRK